MSTLTLNNTDMNALAIACGTGRRPAKKTARRVMASAMAHFFGGIWNVEAPRDSVDVDAIDGDRHLDAEVKDLLRRAWDRAWLSAQNVSARSVDRATWALWEDNGTGLYAVRGKTAVVIRDRKSLPDWSGESASVEEVTDLREMRMVARLRGRALVESWREGGSEAREYLAQILPTVKPYKSASAAERAPHGCSGWSRSGAAKYQGGWALVLWWGPASWPTDARLVGRGGRIIADGVGAVEAALGI